jgi:hypothetical protein
MGTDLIPILNHQLPFEGKTLVEIIALIQPRLDAIVLDNRGFFLKHMYAWEEASPQQRLVLAKPSPWQPILEDPLYYDFNTAAIPTIDFKGPYGLRLSFDPFAIFSFSPPYRYRQWFGLQNADGSEATAARNEWRRYLRQVAYAFGGDRVLYLADNTHPLEKYWYEEKPVAEIERQMRQELGEPKKTFREVLENEKHNYYVDYFTDL